LIAPAGSVAKVEIRPGFPLAVLLGNDRLAMADPDHVPAGKYGKAALENLGVWPSVAGKIARAENVRAALNFVSRGEAPLGIVYRTDAAADGRVRIVAVFPAAAHPPIVYPAALLKGAKGPGAVRFFDFLRSSQARDIFRQHGFMPY
ncbi:MAG TPA: molybdate ABC transporter substrate-binding protein, partial [Burkholderiales bacterium]|nr:molybdate ABC transporter substrate-binding protein [Burkholderiales bacterium]